ncbi:MAG: beta-ketoacyl synthase N-terminal-like domain-containing protein [Candidatus Polarisedimenticolia bacterium]|nr:beta-ketoacyl synthase chain length factor [bacterium]
MRRRTLVVGLGAVGSYGAGRAALAAALAAGTPTVRDVDRAAGFHAPGGARTAALVDPATLAPLVPPAAARRMSAPSRFAVAAGKLAAAEAGWGPEPLGARTGCVLAAAYGPNVFTERLLRQILFEGPESASPYLFTECVANAAAAQLAIALKARGPNVTLTQREVGPLSAAARAAALVGDGRLDAALVGAAEEASPFLHAVLDRFRALARPAAGGPEAPRPFDRRRDGFLLAEGALVLAVAAEGSAAAAEAGPLAVLRGGGGAFDPTAPSYGFGRGAAALARRLSDDMTRMGIGMDDIDLIVAGASGARAGDRLIAATLGAAWGGRPLPPVAAPKGIVGEYAGGLLGAAALAAAGAPIARPAGFGEPDPALGVVPAAASGARRVLALDVAAGGAAAWLVAERP